MVQPSPTGKWNSLPKNYQTILTNATANANSWMNARYDMLNPSALKRLVAGGTRLVPSPMKCWKPA
jgi:TRAP-type mannitol/chloroaromatic compound transport system substrate-binding protein